ncbi:MAG: hypothetical protein LAO31_22525 [Acidobacteriia bacterium]|nr:hypothetical protein [Terriglobia bacterium]
MAGVKRWISALKYNVLLLDDRFAGCTNPVLARTQLVKGMRELLFGGMGRLCESSIVYPGGSSIPFTAAPKVYNRPWSITAEVMTG